MTTSASPFELSATPGTSRRDDRPPIEMDLAHTPGVAAPVRRTARMRRIVNPHPWPGSDAGTSLLDEQARRRWCALIGPGAVADLLRLATAAARGRSLPRPINLETLARYGFVTSEGKRLLVRTSFPTMTIPMARRLHPSLRGTRRAQPTPTTATA